MLRGIAALLLAVGVTAALPAMAQGPVGYQVVSNGPDGVELRFHGIPLRGVHADDNQNALSIDFQSPVDGAVFDRLPNELPQWISMSYANFDNGIIRSPRPVTFLTRAEPDGFSLRIAARGPAPMQGPPPQQQPMQGPPPQYAQQYPPQGPQPYPGPGPYGQYPPPQYPAPQQYIPPAQQAGFHTYGEYNALRAYEAQELSVRPGDPIWSWAYGRAAMQSGSGVSIGSEADWFHGGDRMIATDLTARVSFLNGIALIGDAKWTDVSGRNVRLATGVIAASLTKDIVTGDAGLSFELGRDSEVRLEGVVGNNVAGGKLELYSGSPTGFGFVKFDYHNPDVATPTAVAFRAQTDKGVIGYGGMLGWNVWGSLSGGATRYGVHGDSDVARTGGWDGNLRWQADVYGGLLAGVSYDGHGEYRINYDTRTPPPGNGPAFVPLGIRNMEDHAVTATLSSTFFDQLWFSAYAGYVVDRFASDGLLAGLDIHYTPAPGIDIALGARQSAVSFVQGETGRQTTANLNVTLGFGSPAQPSWMANRL